MRRGKYITWSELKVGIMVVLTSLILAISIFFLGREGGIFMKRYRIITYMERINGLQVGAPVWLAGVKVGSVSEISFPEDVNRTEIRVVMEIDDDVKDRIREDSHARIGTLGLLGDKFVSITQGSLDQPPVQPGGTIQGDTPVDVEQLITTASNAVDDLVVTLEHAQNIAKKIDEGSGTLGKLINEPEAIDRIEDVTLEMKTLLDKINSGHGTIGRLVNDPALYDRLTGFVSQADGIASEAREGRGTIGKLLRDPTLYNNLTMVTSRMDSILIELRKGEGTAGRLLTDTELYDRMNRVSKSVEELMEDVRKNPQRYINIKIF
jgi:phospholipid/cholesterol/gamma-HCH transport system substrate-binding protein